MYHIGVVGPGQSVERILDVAREFEKELRFHPFTYKKAVETKEIVMEHKDQVDAWLFSGPIFVLMFMFLDYHPAFTQALYRVGDSITNPITPMLPYLVCYYLQPFFLTPYSSAFSGFC